ncbi:asparaginase [Cellulomonas triticagri]|uniref:Asparaginase n=1 Tax=Cellulomonas triticagri TaxID=2483352 RepID=A0A3M2JP10_9CELL|nr:asparaginase [Cellulomonas triticagri]RMI13363.1 asparaginase [Cellulomonas triticagri]
MAAARAVAAGASDVATGAVPLARVVRGDVVESVHLGHLVVLAPDGSVRLALGDPEVTILARSSLKPLQAVGMLRAGLDLDPPHLALACASHDGTPEHVRVVRESLLTAGLSETALENTPDLPLDPDAAAARRAEGHGPEPVTQNCSGKHAAMLVTCVAHTGEEGWDTERYLDAEHPVQVACRAAVEELTGVPAWHVTVDGCGAPLFSTSLTGLARAFARIAVAPATEPGSPLARVATAMTTHPDLVGGERRDVTRAMRALPGLVAKDGADGVYAAALPDGSAVAFKVLDGSARPRPAVLAEALRVAGAATLPGADLAALDTLGRTAVLGHGEPVGAVVPAFAAGSPA